MQRIRWGFALLLLAGVMGCQSSLMVKPDIASSTMPTPAAGKALVVFLRPSMFGGAIQSSVYDTRGDSNEFIGIVSTKNKLAYQAAPGEHLFMVVAENADFMIAHLDAGKTYYALISPRPGFWKARFSLLPIHNRADAKYSLKSSDFQDWMRKTSWVRVTPAARQWYQQNKASILEKQASYMRKWNQAPAQQHEQLTLLASDGT